MGLLSGVTKSVELLLSLNTKLDFADRDAMHAYLENENRTPGLHRYGLHPQNSTVLILVGEQPEVGEIANYLLEKGYCTRIINRLS